ncbi:hypothetical protein HK405_003929, partial [Cladochytrium tenue]
PMHESRYKRIIQACALAPDLAALQDGDLTEIGEKGITLSGGQKQRVSLARTLYSGAQVVLLDDPLSAVDAPTALHLMTEAIQEFLSGRTVILVTHAIGLALRAADHVIVLDGGRVLTQGPPVKVTETLEFRRIYGDSAEYESDIAFNEPKSSLPTAAHELTDPHGTEGKANDEEKSTGFVKFSVYKSYFVAAGVIPVGIGVLFYLDALIGVIQVGVRAFLSLTTVMASVQASRVIHERLLNSVLGAPLRFFELLRLANMTAIGAAKSWVSFRMDIISATTTFAAGSFMVLSNTPPAWAGLALMYAMQLTEALVLLVKAQADMELSMNAVESQGVVEFRDLSIKYAPDLPLILHNVSFKTKAGEKIGIVGRTGAGKSTLSLALFRILPFARGTILMDGVDIASVGLHYLRSRLTIIPQDPVLFAGTIRFNLDPCSEKSDDELHSALRSTNLLGSADVELSGTPNITLDTVVHSNGANLSQGQRQLVCLARALARSTRVILLDEATASIEPAIDAAIQETIRRELASATVLCIAHRLRTVANFDRILVLADGRVVEFGTPLQLMRQSGGAFRKMCEDTGEMAELLRIAGAGAA